MTTNWQDGLAIRQPHSPAHVKGHDVPSVTVYTLEVAGDDCLQALEPILAMLPIEEQARVRRLRYPKHQAMTLAGKALLLRHLHRVCPGEPRPLLRLLERQHTGRPIHPMIDDFSISHSGTFVVLAVAPTGSGIRLGVDIEIIGSQWRIAAGVAMSVGERRRIHLSGEPEREFFRMWTFKEAVLKADGSGFAVPPSAVNTCVPSTVVGGRMWFVASFNVAVGYAGHVATSCPACIRVERLDASDLPALCHCESDSVPAADEVS